MGEKREMSGRGKSFIMIRSSSRGVHIKVLGDQLPDAHWVLNHLFIAETSHAVPLVFQVFLFPGIRRFAVLVVVLRSVDLDD